MVRKSVAIVAMLSVAAALFVTLRDNPDVETSDALLDRPKHKSTTADAAPEENRPRETRRVERTALAGEEADPDSLWIDELRSASLSEVMQRHWPAAQQGNADSMVLVHAIMMDCLPYRRRFDGKDIAEVHARFAQNNDPQLNALNDSVWLHCADIYANWNKYDGWRQMMNDAARLGQPYAMLKSGWSNLDDEKTLDEGLAQIVTAIQSGDPVAITTMMGVYASVGADPGASHGWLLAACELGLDCSADGALMTNACGPFSQTCGVNESVRDYVIREQGDYVYQLARERAREIVDAVTNGKLEELDIEAELRTLLAEQE